jgi:hypothetical protein
MRFRKLRVAWSVLWLAICLLLAFCWHRYDGRTESGQFFIWQQSGVGFLVSEGTASVKFGKSPEVMLLLHELRLDSVSFISHDLSRPIPPPEPVRTQPRPRFYWELGYVRAPFWFWITIAAVIGAAPWTRPRFSLRTLLIAMTVCAAILGLAVWAK